MKEGIIKEGIEKNIEWTDEQLMLLEQITYIADWYQLEDEEFKVDDVGAMVNSFDDEKLAELDAMTNESPGDGMTATGAEWAAIIRAIQEDEELMQLELKASDTDAEMYCFTHPNNEDEAIVVFRGTVDGNEWYDNVEGLDTSDTECQIEALDFVESLPYDDIIAVGHSKGGNKAQYVTILSDKVTQCLAMDAQGFSQKFFDKYSAEIAERGHLITNHSLANDYVHILLFPIPGSTQIYYEGMKENYGFPQNHYASNFFVYTENEEGELELKLSKVVDEEAQFVTYLREFTYFIINEMPASEKPDTIAYVGTLLALLMSDKNEEFSISYQGVTYQKSEVGAMALSDPDALATVLAYFFKYADTYNITGSEISSLVSEFLGSDILNLNVPLLSSEIEIPEEWLTDPLAWVLDSLRERILNDKIDYNISKELIQLDLLLTIIFYVHADINLAYLWEKIQSEYKKIDDVNKRTANDCGEIIDGYTKDFSENTYAVIIGTIDSSDKIQYYGTSGWGNYAGEPWYGSLPIEKTRNNISLYFTKLSETQSVCKERINTIFEQISDVHETDSTRIRDVGNSLCTISSSILCVAEGIG